MTKIPDQLWIMCIAGMGCILALVGFLVRGDAAAQQYIFGAANTLISGAIGAWKGATSVKASVGNVQGEAGQ